MTIYKTKAVTMFEHFQCGMNTSKIEVKNSRYIYIYG